MVDLQFVGEPGVFGEWDAPMTDGLPQIEPPVGRACVWCDEPIQPDDNGQVARGGHIEHRECSLRTVMGGIGHCVDHVTYCHGVGPDAGLSRRESSLLVWEWFQETRMSPTAEQCREWEERLKAVF